MKPKISKNKYNNKKVEVDGILFDSIAESKYYQQLKWAKENKVIKKFELQPKFILQEKFKKYDKTFLPITYKADFLVTSLDGSVEVIDIKGYPDQKFPIKRKMFEYKFPNYSLKVLKYSKTKGFYEI